MSRRIPQFTAEASLYKSSVNKNMTTGYHDLSTSSQIVPQVLQDPNRPRKPIIVKDRCAVICFLSGTGYRCTTVC
jgi:hypothetical protein